MNKLVSIITVSYNSDKTIEETINSVLHQSYKRIEYIIIDGASTDNTVSIIKKYSKKASELGIAYKWLSEQDNGIYDAMNKGLKKVTGEIVGIINCGDGYYPGALKKVAEFYTLKENQDKVLCGKMQKVNENREDLFICEMNEGIFKSKLHNAMPLNHPATFIPNKLYKEHGDFNTSFQITGDYDLIYRFYQRKIQFQFSEEMFAYMMAGGISEIWSTVFIRVKEHYRVRRGYRNSLVNFSISLKNYLIFNAKFGIRYLQKSLRSVILN